MKKSIDALKDFLSCAWAEGERLEEIFKLRLIFSFSAIGSVFLLLNVVINLISKNMLLVVIPLGFLVFLVALNIFLYKTRQIERYLLLFTILYFAFALSLVLQETESKSGTLLWLLVFPPIISSIHRKVTGKIFSVMILAIITFVLFDDHILNILPTSYDYRYGLRLIMVYILIMFFSHYSNVSQMNLENRLKIMNNKLTQMAHTDPLTGISNRRDILKRLEYEKIRANIHKSKFSIILADIDNFKRINDRLGHNCGDQILKELAEFIVSSLRKQDVTGRLCEDGSRTPYLTSRWGGEEFLILLPETDQYGANVVAEKLRLLIQKHQFKVEEKELNITMSFGTCEFSSAGDIDKCIACADRRLYQAKKMGRNRVGVV